jgi:hypothetical protein
MPVERGARFGCSLHGHDLAMKHALSSLFVVALVAAGTGAFADDHHHHPMHRPMQRARYHEGQIYQGHRLHYYHGHWGYYRPHNGANVFISIPI